MKYIAIFALLSLVACYGRKPDKTGLEGQLMPDMIFSGLDGVNQFATHSIPTGKSTILLSFEPWCPYCKAQIQDMVANADEFKGVNIYMVSSSPADQIKTFANQYKLAAFPNISCYTDTSKSMEKYFNDARIPFTTVYGPDKKLRQVFIGKAGAKLIGEAARNQ